MVGLMARIAELQAAWVCNTRGYVATAAVPDSSAIKADPFS